MKKSMLFLSAVLALSLIAGCTFSDPVLQPAETTGSTTPTTVPTAPTTVPTTPTTAPNDPTTVPTDPPEPTEPPLMVEMRSLLSSGWFNQALTSTYSEPEYLDLYEFFYNGFPEESKKPTDEEWELLKNIPGFTKGYNLIRLPASKMNEVLLRYFGRTLESNCIGLDKFTYLESTDCYYHMTLESNTVGGIHVTKVEELNEVTFIYYTTDSSDQQFRVTLLDYFGNGYTVTANQMIMDNDSLTWFAGFPEPDNYRRLFASEYLSNPRLLLDVFLHDPDTFVKYIALEEKGWGGPAHHVSLAMRNFDGTEVLKQYVAACKRIAEDPTSTPDEQNAAFMMIWDKIGQEAARSYTLQALEKKTPLDDYTVDICLIKLNPQKGWVAQFYPYPYIYSSWEGFQNTVANHKKNEFYDMTVTNGLCPESYEQLAATYDADFFEKNVLIRIDLAGNKDVLPIVAKVTAGPETHWNAPLSVYMEFDESNREELTHYVLLIAVPREYYQPTLYRQPVVDCISNGNPHVW